MWRVFLLVQRKREREKRRTHKWSASRSVKLLELPSKWKLSTPLWATSGDAKNLPFSLTFSSHTPPPRTTALIFPPILFCDVVESIYRGYPCPRRDPPPARFVLFSSSTIHVARESGTLSAASSRLRKAPTRPRERRFDKDQTERTEENNWSAFVWIAGERGLLFVRSFFYLAISGLCFGLMEQQTSGDHFPSVPLCRIWSSSVTRGQYCKFLVTPLLRVAWLYVNKLIAIFRMK